MIHFVYLCPATGLNVQGLVVDASEIDDDTFVPVTCHACGRIHLVNPKTAKTQSDDEE